MTEDRGDDGLLEGEVELWRNSQWRVTTIALEAVNREVIGPYWIGLADIHRDMWPEHMAEKAWVDPVLFNEALAKARELFPRVAA